jgi:putative ABC transport system permease protein
MRRKRLPSHARGNAPRRVSRAWLKLCIAVVDIAAVIVPRTQRRDWRREWHAELWYRGQRGASRGAALDGEQAATAGDRPAVRNEARRAATDPRRAAPIEALRIRRARRPASPRGELAVRSLGAFRHAAWLRSQEWKPDMLFQDLRYALRALRRAPTFTVMALLTLGVGIGANAIVFNMLDSVLLTPYPYPQPEQLVDVHGTDLQAPGSEYALSWPTYVDIRDSGVFDGIAVWDWEPMNLRGEDETIYVGVGQVTASLFDVLRVEPLVGRVFTAEEDAPGRSEVVVLTEGFWRTQYGGDPGVVGRTVQLDGRTRVVVGVMPEEASYPDEIEAWVPLGASEETAPRSSNWLGSLARMQPGMSIEQTNAALRPLAQRIAEDFPDLYTDRGLAVTSLRDDRVGDVRPFFLILLGAVGFLLLIVCANVANLLLARASAREREISVRLALGASRTRLVRQLLTESLLLSLGGLAIGFSLSNWAGRAILATIPLELPVWIQVRTNLGDLLYTGGVALAATVMFGLVPALQATRPDVRATLAEASGRAGGMRRRFTRNALVVAEVAISLMLLVGAGLMARSFAELSEVSPGFESEQRLMATMQMPRGKYTSGEMQVSFYREMLQRLAALPGVENVAAVSRMPMAGSSNRQWFMYEGQDPDEARRNPSALHNSVSPGYFETLGIPLLAGRGFRETDSSAAPRVVVVNDAVVSRFLPEGEPLGRRLTFDGENWWEIVGVVGSVRHYGLDTPAQLQAYVPYEQWPQGRLSVVLHTRGDPAAMGPQLRSEIRAIDPDQALYDLMPVSDAVARTVWMPGFFSSLMRVFAIIAAAIAAVGIYGVTAYSVSRRTQELGVRMALGAERRAITRMVILQSMTVVAIGIVIGLVLAVGQGMALESILYEISGTDPATFATVVALILIVSLVAAWLPARRATGLDPVRALRNE